MLGREHGREGTGGGGAAAQTARLLRPLRRRAERIDRPARVRMRSRNPCTLWRRRLFGWYVRLLTSSLRWDQGRLTPGLSARPPDASDGADLTWALAWTCGTRRPRVTEKRYAGVNREVKSNRIPVSPLGARLSR